jgi:hypothetical protein
MPNHPTILGALLISLCAGACSSSQSYYRHSSADLDRIRSLERILVLPVRPLSASPQTAARVQSKLIEALLERHAALEGASQSALTFCEISPIFESLEDYLRDRLGEELGGVEVEARDLLTYLDVEHRLDSVLLGELDSAGPEDGGGRWEICASFRLTDLDTSEVLFSQSFRVFGDSELEAIDALTRYAAAALLEGGFALDPDRIAMEDTDVVKAHS